MRVLVAGAGAVGQWLGARLQQAGHDVLLWTTPRHVEALQDLQVTGESTFRGAVPAAAAPGEGPYDAILVTGKAHATLDLALGCAGTLAADGFVASLQNGFGNGEKLAAVFGASRVAVALTSHGLTLEAPGRLLHAGTGATKVGPHDIAHPAAAQRAFGLLSDAGLEPQRVEDVVPHVWLKALVNHAVNPLAALDGIENGALLDEARWPRCRTLVHEGWSLSRAAGVPLPGATSEAELEGVVRSTLERTRRNRCSMLQDVTQRRVTEVEQISGHLVRLARRLGYPFFASDEVYRAVKALEARLLGDDVALASTRAEVSWQDRVPGPAGAPAAGARPA